MITGTVIFHKMQAAGNDFVVLDTISTPLPAEFDYTAAAIALCDRHRGVGADGLLTLERAQVSCPVAQVRMRMWNPDGTQDMCGNGLRCVTALAWRQQHVLTPQFRVQTLAGVRDVEILSPTQARSGMGQPQFSPAAIPFAQSNPIEYQLEVAGRSLTATTLSTGSTHTVIFLDAPLTEADFSLLSPQIEHHPLFPDRTSVLWAVPAGDNCFKVRIWERGVGETLACGTGACAVAVAAHVTQRTKGVVQVESRGGTLEVDWKGGENEILLTGPANYVFEGMWQGEVKLDSQTDFVSRRLLT